MRLGSLFALLAACACAPQPPESPPVDLDGDGFDADRDCDDHDPLVFPGAPESCNFVDDDCDSEIDEGFDADLDGFRSTACPTGTDCDDHDPLVFPGAPESCNFVDDDCDSEIDEGFDADLDGFRSTACPTGTDCDDLDPQVFPGAPERCNGADDNCNAEVDEGFDSDLDGFRSTECQTGTDCDDNDPNVHPERRFDWWFDDVDSNCDTQDRQTHRLDEAPWIIDAGRDMMSIYSFTSCDVDGDGSADLILGGSDASRRNGRIAVFLGKNLFDHARRLTVSNADAIIDQITFEDGEAACGDLDGDGRDDLVIGDVEYLDGEIVRSTTIFYGDSLSLSGAFSRADGIKLRLGTYEPSDRMQVGWLAMGDVSRDGKANVVILHDRGQGESRSAMLWVLPSERYGLDGRWADHTTPERWPIGLDERRRSSAVVLPNVDGRDQVYVRSGSASNEVWAVDVAPLSLTANWIEPTGSSYGHQILAADLQGNGAADLVVADAWDASGALYLYYDSASISSFPNRVVRGENGRFFAWQVAAVGDLDRDGGDDLLVWDAQEVNRREGVLRLLSGRRLTGDESLDAATLLAWKWEDDRVAWLQVDSDDLDGDGAEDLIIHDGGAIPPGDSGGISRVYLYPSTYMGW